MSSGDVLRRGAARRCLTERSGDVGSQSNNNETRAAWPADADALLIFLGYRTVRDKSLTRF